VKAIYHVFILGVLRTMPQHAHAPSATISC
jgi:hypothetical protein